METTTYINMAINLIEIETKLQGLREEYKTKKQTLDKTDVRIFKQRARALQLAKELYEKKQGTHNE